MDSTLIAYSISFISLLILLYWKMRRQFLAILDAKQKSIQDAIQTAEYIKNFSVTTLYEETQKNNNIQNDIDQIQAESTKNIALVLKAHKDFQSGIQKQFDRDLEEHIKQINTHFIQDVKKEISELIVARIRQRLQGKSQPLSPAQQFAARMR